MLTQIKRIEILKAFKFHGSSLLTYILIIKLNSAESQEYLFLKLCPSDPIRYQGWFCEENAVFIIIARIDGLLWARLYFLQNKSRS